MANGIQKDLGKVTAYSYAKAAGYTGTEEQFQAIFNEFTEDAPGLIDRMDTAVARAEAAVTNIDATIQDAVDDAVEEATASAVATANQAVTDAQAAQTAAEGAVTQANNAVTQANAAVTAAQAAQSAAEDAAESFVIDDTLSVSGAAADAKKTGDEVSGLKTAFMQNLVSTTIATWEKGSFDTTNGSNYADNSRIRSTTAVGISTGVRNFTCDSGYSTLMYAWDLSGNYVGAYKTDGTWTKAVSNWKSVTEFDLSTVPNYVVKFAMSRVPSSSDIAATEGNKLTLYRYTDDTLTIANKPADAKVVGDEINALKDLTYASVNFGWLQSTDIYPDYGTDRDNRPTRSRSGYILLPKNSLLTVIPSPWYIQWYRYNATTKAWIDKSSFTASWTNAEFSLKNTDADYLYRFVVRDANANANVTASSITVVGKMYSPIVTQVNKNTNDIAQLLNNNSAEFVSPTSLRICGGIQQNMYYQNILKGFDAKNAYCIKTTTYATNYNDFARLQKTDSTSESHGFKFNLYRNNSSSYLESKTLNYQIVPKSSGTGLSKKALIIGDSLTYNQPLTKHLVDDLLDEDVMTVELIGTLGTAPYLREGRSGWGAYTYTHEASHTNESGTTFTNAFWNPSTSKFDFSYYMSQNSFSGVDYVFICLGTNDFGRTPSDVATDIQEMITSIHAYSSSIRVGVWTPPTRGLTGNGSLVDRDVLLGIVNAILTAFEGKESQKIYTVPVTLNVDPYYDFPMEAVNVSADNTNYQILVTTDLVHPSTAGYKKMGDMIYSYIKYFGSLDAT